MALIKCKECGNEISTKASSCPKCGAKIEKKTSVLIWVLAIMFGLSIFGVITSGNKEASGPPIAAATSSAQISVNESSLPTYTAMQIANDYEANTISADQKYKGSRFKIKGSVTNINTDFAGDPYITLGGPNEFMEPQFSFDKSELNQLAQLKKGMRITVACTGRGDVIKIPMQKECRLVE